MTTVKARALRSLPLAAKAALTSGGDTWHSTGVDGVLRRLVFGDGPHGVRTQGTDTAALGIGASIPATCFPPAVALGSSWHPDLLRRVGAALGREARTLGVDVLLGPGMNIKRSPLGGRNFEYLAEDPYLTGRLAAALVEGIQSAGVAACVKHFAVNNQETDRMRVDARVDERTLREIYLSAFEHVIRTARPWVVMAAYNAVNGVPASEHHGLLDELLCREWGFDGLVISDWGAVTDRLAALRAGLDVEMPPSGTDERVAAAAAAGALDPAVLDRVAERLSRLAARIPADPTDTAGGPEVLRAANDALAREAAAASMVLLKNEAGLLPLDPERLHTLAVIGRFAAEPRIQAGGSSRVVPTRRNPAVDALRERLGDAVRYAPGFHLDGRPDAALRDEAVAAAAAADVTAVFLGVPESAESEGFDRTTIELPADQLDLLHRVAAVSGQVVVVLCNGGVVSVARWQDDAAAVLETWLPGQAGGDAIADVLLGAAEPGGRLAETIPLRLADHPSYLSFPGDDGTAVYGEGVFVGYRYFDTVDVPVAYPFGHGLGYTRFAYSDLSVAPTGENRWDVTCTVTNAGSRSGAEIVQLYIGPCDTTARRPAAELCAFARTELDPGASAAVTMSVGPRELSYWDARHARWSLPAGDYRVLVGASSRDIRLRARVHSAGDRYLPPLTATSTIGEWLGDPAGREVLDRILARLPHREETLAAAPELARLLAAMPLTKLRTFGLGLTDEVVEELVAEAAARHRELRNSGAYR